MEIKPKYLRTPLERLAPLNPKHHKIEKEYNLNVK